MGRFESEHAGRCLALGVLPVTFDKVAVSHSLCACVCVCMILLFPSEAQEDLWLIQSYSQQRLYHRS